MSEHAEPVAWTQPSCPGEYLSMDKDEYHTVPLYTAPLNLNDSAVQKRLAAQWGYVKAEPVQNSQDFGVAGSATSSWRESAAQGCSPGGTGMPATPPQRKPLTDEEIERLWQKAYPYYNQHDFARAIERAHGIGNDDA